jgi:hypothetical protein
MSVSLMCHHVLRCVYYCNMRIYAFNYVCAHDDSMHVTPYIHVHVYDTRAYICACVYICILVSTHTYMHKHIITGQAHYD